MIDFTFVVYFLLGLAAFLGLVFFILVKSGATDPISYADLLITRENSEFVDNEEEIERRLKLLEEEIERQEKEIERIIITLKRRSF